MNSLGWLIAVSAIAFGGWNLWKYVGTNDRIALYIALGCLFPIPLYLVLSGVQSRKKTYRWFPGMVFRVALGSLAILAMGVALLYTTVSRTVGCARRLGPGAQLEHCNFRGKDLREADLHGANLFGADLRTANLQGADLRGANLGWAELSGADLVGAKIDGVMLAGANLQEVTGLPDEALAEALDVDLDELARALSRSDVRLESRESILAALGDACRGQGVLQAAPYGAGRDFHPLVLLSDAGEPHDMTDDVLERALEPMALRFAELVVCVGEEEEVLVQTCEYINGPSTRRYKYPIYARAVEARTGVLVAECDFEETPRVCPLVKGSSDSDRIEAHVPFESMVGWLAWLVGTTRPEEVKEPMATPTLAPTPTRRPTATAAPAITPISDGCPPNAVYVADVNVPDGTSFSYGEPFTKTWRIRSAGCAPWPDGTRLVLESGDQLGAPDGIEVPETELGDSAEISVPMQAPEETGSYSSYWQMEAPDGTRFGDRIYVKIVVR
jgi:hypothetical protein